MNNSLKTAILGSVLVMGIGVVGAAETDLDSDGVADRIDQCQCSTRMPVDVVGCPAAEALPVSNGSDSAVDTDRDGVADGVDLCPDATHNRVVDHNGCSVTAFFNASGVYFFNSAKTPKKSSYEVINSSVCALQDALKKSPGAQLVVAGYSDGHRRGGQALAQSRANFVRNYLIGKGVDGSRLTAVAQPYREATDCTGEKVERCLEQNRRVELHIK